MNTGLAPLLSFIAVVAMIPLALWLFKRSPLGAGAGTRHLRSVSVLPLSTSQRIVTVEVGSGDHRTWLVLGVSPGGISTLHTMLPQDDGPAVPPAPPNVTFSQLLNRLKKNPDAS